MQHIEKIDKPEEMQKVYLQIVKIYGIDIFQEQRRAIACMLDIAPKLQCEAEYLETAYKEGILKHFQDAVSDEQAKGYVETLVKNGVPFENAVTVIESLGLAHGQKLSVRPDYSKGGQIPYETSPDDGITAAIDKLDHIRWYLNNQDGYIWKKSNSEITELRSMMNQPQANRDQLVESYKKIVHNFQNNDPFFESILFGDSENDGDFTAKYFGNYFVVIDGTPVSVECARLYGETDRAGWEDKKEKFHAKAKQIKDEILYMKTEQLDRAMQLKSQMWRYVLSGIVLLPMIVFLLRNMLLQMDYEYIGNILKNHPSKGAYVLAQFFKYAWDSDSKPYILITAATVLMAIIDALFMLYVLCTVLRYIELKNIVKQRKKITIFLDKFESEIPEQIDEIGNSIKSFLNNQTQKLVLDKYDYRAERTDVLKLGKNNIKLPYPVSGKGMRIRVISCIFGMALFGVTKTETYTMAMEQSLDMNEFLQEREKLIDTAIPLNALKYEGHYYYVYSGEKSWEDAYQKCKDLGGHLVTITSQKENEKIYKYLEAKEASGAFLGLYLDVNSGKEVWKWVTGEKMDYGRWEGDEPNSREGECYCGVFSMNDHSKWRAVTPDYFNVFICEWDGIPSLEKEEVDIEKGYSGETLVFKTHHYAVLKGAESFKKAQRKCVDYGGHLAVINDKVENDVLFQFVKRSGYDSSFLGYSKQKKEKTWKWVDESRNKYKNWSKGEPNGKKDANYAYFTQDSQDGKWSTGKWLNEDAIFLCEWDE